MPIAQTGTTSAGTARYLVIRQMSQDVRGFWRFVDEASRASNGGSGGSGGSGGTADPDARTRLAAKMVGRWPNGAPVDRLAGPRRPGLERA